MEKIYIYQSENFKIYKDYTPIVLLETEKGFFSTIDDHYIGKYINGFRQADGSIVAKYSKVKQNLSNGRTLIWIFDPEKGYWHE